MHQNMPRMVQVRDVPDVVHHILRERAARRGKSLSAYVLEHLEHLARQQPLEEWLEEMHGQPRVRFRVSTTRLVRRERKLR